MKTLVATVALLTACGGGAPKVRIGPDHFYKRTTAAKAPDLAGTYEPLGTFGDRNSHGASLVLTQGMKNGPAGSPSIQIKRMSPGGDLEAVGIGMVVGEQLFVAWELGKPELLNGTIMVELYVVDFKAAGFEGFVESAGQAPFTGTFGNGTPPAKLAVGSEATYSLIKQSYGGPDRKWDLSLRRYQDQFYMNVASSGRNYNGTAMLAGDTQLAGAVVSEHQTDVKQLAVGVYTIEGGVISGRSVFMDNERDSNKTLRGGMAGTLKLPAENETWTRAGAGAPAATPSVPQ